jgi:outer membrane protein
LRHNLLVAVAVLALVLTASVNAWPAGEFAYINSLQVLSEYVGAGDLDAQLAASNADWQAQAREKQQEIDGLISELRNQRLLLSDEAAAEKESAIQQKQYQLEEFLHSVWGEGGLAEQRKDELWRPVINRINAILEEIGTENEYSMIFDAAYGVVAYAAPDIDITQQVLDRLNGAEE